MSDFARLEDKLNKLRQRERAPGEGRKLRASGAEALLAAIVTEIDETILPRRLTFTLENGTAIHLAAANRKLQALLSPAPDGFDADLADQELPDADDPKVASLAVGLRNILEGAETLRLSAIRPKSLFASDVGVTTSQLKRAWGVSEQGAGAEEKDPSELLSGFLSGLGDDALAWLRIEGEAVTDQGGDEKALAALGESAAVFLDGYFSKFDEAFPEASLSCGTVIAPSADHPSALFFVEIGELSAIISANRGKIFNLASRWQGLVSD